MTAVPAGALTTRVGRFTAGYLLLFVASSVARGDRRIVAYLVVVGGLALALRRAHRVARFSPSLCGALAACGLLHMCGGLVPSPTDGVPILYETWVVPELLKFDQLVHFTTSAVLTVALWQLLDRWMDPACAGPWARAGVAVLACLGWGALNEAFEFLSSLRFENFVGGLDNTGWDLVFNAFGALTTGAWLACSTPPAPAQLDAVDLGAPARSLVDLPHRVWLDEQSCQRNNELSGDCPAPASRSRAAGVMRWK